jgi:hypothetical protein
MDPVGPVVSGVTGTTVLNKFSDRVNKYAVWSYGPGDQAYYKYMTIDVTQQPNEASLCFVFVTLFPREVSLLSCLVVLSLEL